MGALIYGYLGLVGSMIAYASRGYAFDYVDFVTPILKGVLGSTTVTAIIWFAWRQADAR